VRNALNTQSVSGRYGRLSRAEAIIGNKILIDQRKISKVGDSMTRLEPN